MSARSVASAIRPERRPWPPWRLNAPLGFSTIMRASGGQGERASFAPIINPEGVGNGVQVHFSLETVDGTPACHDPDQPHEVARPSDWAAQAFGETLVDVIERHKRTEIGLMEGLPEADICNRYHAAY